MQENKARSENKTSKRGRNIQGLGVEISLEQIKSRRENCLPSKENARRCSKEAINQRRCRE